MNDSNIDQLLHYDHHHHFNHPWHVFSSSSLYFLIKEVFEIQNCCAWINLVHTHVGLLKENDKIKILLIIIFYMILNNLLDSTNIHDKFVDCIEEEEIKS